MLAQVGLGAGDNGDDGDGDEPGNSGNNYIADERLGKYNIGKRGEFILVDPRNVTITPFSGRNLHSNSDG